MRIDFFHSAAFGRGKVKMFQVRHSGSSAVVRLVTCCQFWFNTRFLDPNPDDPTRFLLTLPKNQIDKACKVGLVQPGLALLTVAHTQDTKHKIFPANMSVFLVLQSQASVEGGATPAP